MLRPTCFSNTLTLFSHCSSSRIVLNYSKTIMRYNCTETTMSQLTQDSTDKKRASNPFESLNKSLDKYSLNPRISNQDCVSCGTLLQTVDPNIEGFYIQPTSQLDSTVPGATRSNSRSYKNSQFLSAFSKLDEEGRSLLINQKFKNEEVIITSKRSKVLEPLVEEITCKRCHDAIYHSQYDTNTIQPLTLSQILETIPVRSSLYHVISAIDFPLSLLNIPARQGEIKFIMNKTDMIFGHNATIEKYDSYFRHVIRRLTGYKNSPMYMVSAYSNWGIKGLINNLKDEIIYLVGYVNTGKTKLAQRIETSYKSFSSTKVDYKKLLGSSHFPALTRDTIEHRLTSRKSVIDTPGLISKYNSFSNIKSEHLKNLSQGKKLIISEMRKERYHSAKDNQVVSIAGGLVLLKIPNNTIVQLKNACFGDLRNFTNIEKAIQILTNQPDSLKKSIFIKENSMDQLQRFVIPPFYGTIDLLIKDIGFVQIKPTGAMSAENELFEVYAPRGVILGIRETIEHFLTGYIKTQTTKERKHYHKGEVVKITKSEKLSLKPKNIPEYKIFSQLYQVPLECEDIYLEMVRQFEEKELHHDSNRNKYWIESL